LLGFSSEERLAGDVQRDPAGERDASLEAFLASCGDQINESEIHGSKETAASREIEECKMHGSTCLAALASEVTNKQHGPDMMPEREASPLSDEFVLASFCGGGVSCCGVGVVSSSHCLGLMRRGAVSMRRLGRRRFLLPCHAPGRYVDGRRRRTSVISVLACVCGPCGSVRAARG